MPFARQRASVSAAAGRVRHNDEVSALTGRLLVAVPRPHELDCPDIFTRSVVFVLHHGDDGAQGLVLTSPLEATVDDVLPGWNGVLSRPEQLFQGGPVGLDMAIGLANVPGHDEVMGATRIFGSLSLVDLDAPAAVLAPHVAGMRIFAGSAGWDAGQLDAELEAGVWIVVEPEIADVFDGTPETLWARVLRRQSTPMSLLASFPTDPSLN